MLRGLLVALISSGIVLGSLSLSLVENGVETAAQPSPTLASPTGSAQEQLATPTATLAGQSSQTPRATMTAAPPTACPPPAGWRPYTVQSGDTLESLARSYSTTPVQIGQANCLISTNLLPGTVLYLPAAPARPTATVTATPARTATRTTIPCGPPAGWVRYTVQAEDNLYKLSQMFGVSVSQLQQANCLGYSNIIRLGSIIYVPYTPTRTPVPPTETSAPTETPTEALPSATNTPEPVTPVASETPATPAATQAESTPGP